MNSTQASDHPLPVNVEVPPKPAIMPTIRRIEAEAALLVLCEADTSLQSAVLPRAAGSMSAAVDQPLRSSPERSRQRTPARCPRGYNRATPRRLNRSEGTSITYSASSLRAIRIAVGGTGLMTVHSTSVRSYQAIGNSFQGEKDPSRFVPIQKSSWFHGLACVHTTRMVAREGRNRLKVEPRTKMRRVLTCMQ